MSSSVKKFLFTHFILQKILLRKNNRKFSISFCDSLPARSPLAQSTPVRPVANPTVMPDADDHTPTRSRDQQVSNQQVNLDFGDDDDELFDGNPAVGPLPLPAAVQQRLSDIQSQMDPDARARLQRLSDSLNNHEIERVQPVQPDPNEVRPIRRRRVSNSKLQMRSI